MAEVEKQRKKATGSSVNIVHGGKCEKSECKQFSKQQKETESERQTIREKERERGALLWVCWALALWACQLAARRTEVELQN